MLCLKFYHFLPGSAAFDLGLERTGGFETVAFCEIDHAARAVLTKHWPEVPHYEDVRRLTGAQLRADGIAVDVICGGFPCQDISLAGAGAGIEGKRSGLWADYSRLIGELRPRFVIVENVSALLGRGLDRVLGDVAALGYDAEWHCIPASAVGAPHRRDRLWVVAYPNSECRRAGANEGWAGFDHGHQASDSGSLVADAAGERRGEARGGEDWGRFARGCRAVEHEWDVEPRVGRVAHGVPDRVDRLKQLGNAVVPQIPELIGRAILASLADQRKAT